MSFVYQLVTTGPVFALFIVGCIVGLKVRPENNSAGMLTIVGWGMLLCSRLVNLVVLFVVRDDSGVIDSSTLLWNASTLMTWMASLIGLSCVLLGILRLASGGITSTRGTSASIRNQPLDISATGDR